jgi:hypothetical protein
LVFTFKIQVLSKNSKILKDLEATHKHPPGIIELINYGTKRLREIYDEFLFNIHRIIVAEDDPIIDITNSVTQLVERNIKSRLNRNEFRIGLLVNLETSTWENDFSLLEINNIKPIKQDKIDKSPTVYASEPVEPGIFKTPLIDHIGNDLKKKKKLNSLWGKVRADGGKTMRAKEKAKDSDYSSDDEVIDTKSDSSGGEGTHG